MPSPSLTLLRTQSDDRLVALAGAGHERAFEAIVERYRRPLLRAARRVLPESRAEDALQQALIAAWTALQRGDEVRDLRAWLYRIVHNTALNALRGNGYDYDELEDTLRITDAGDDELERRAVVRQTLASLAALPDRQREALLRTAVSGFSQEEVARDLGISDNAMRQLIHRARVSMRAAVTALTPLPLITSVAASARSGPLVDRIAELAAGAAPAGAAMTLTKAGAVAVLAGGALSGPSLVDRIADRPQRDATAAAAAATPASRAARAAKTRAGGASTAPAPAAVRTERVVLRAPSHRSGGSSRRGRRRADDRSRKDEERGRSLPGSGGSGESHSRSGREDAGGHGGGDDHSPSSDSGSGDAGSGSDDGSGDGGFGSGSSSSGDDLESGSGSGSGFGEVGGSDGSGDEAGRDEGASDPDGGVPAPLPIATPVATPDSRESGHGSDDGPDE
jgi:RNA polymerase sigma factor (sigma-70 family)